jgi:hypothetical protein
MVSGTLGQKEDLAFIWACEGLAPQELSTKAFRAPEAGEPMQQGPCYKCQFPLLAENANLSR